MLISPNPSTIVGPTPRWTRLREHAEQSRLWNSTARFRVVPAGRRSGKTELAKRFTILQALSQTEYDDAWYILSAPTHAQAKRIYWKDLLALTPKSLLNRRPQTSELTIQLINGAEITVMGMDAAERLEGTPLSGIVLDEYGNCREEIWGSNIRPALADRQGWAWLIGVPEGRNHYFKAAERAKKLAAESALNNTPLIWDHFHWTSDTVLPEEEIEAARAEMDPLLFDQEFNATFLSFSGQAYYCFDQTEHCRSLRPLYNPNSPLDFWFDFNVAPGVAGISQEFDMPGAAEFFRQPALTPSFTAVLDEIWIPTGSNTEIVCQRLIEKFPNHKGSIRIYADATGAARTSTSVRGSNLDIIRKVMNARFPGQVKWRVPKANPLERVRVNSLNARLRAADGKIRMLVDATHAPHVVNDLAGVTIKKDTNGELDKKSSPELTHISDALGYRIHKDFALGEHLWTQSAA